MYQKPEVRMIEPQQISSESSEVTSSEAAALLAKYGYKSQEFHSNIVQQDPTQNMTAEEMFNNYKRELDAQKQREHQRMYGPKPISFDSRNVNYSNSEWRTIDVDGQNNIGIQVQIVSDMPIYRR